MIKSIKILTVVFLAILFSSCGNDTKTYVSRNKDYSLKIPNGWSIEDEERKINKSIEESSQPLDNRVKIDVVFCSHSKSTQGKVGYVMVSDFIPGSSVNYGDSNNYMKANASLASFYTKCMLESIDVNSKVEIRIVNGKELYISTLLLPDKRKSLTAFCSDNEKIFMFQFCCPEKKYDKWKNTFEECFNSISFRKGDIYLADKEYKNEEAGFLTGIFHGVLVIIRFVLSLFGDFEVYASHNSGSSYLWGFIIGCVMVLGGTAKSRS